MRKMLAVSLIISGTIFSIFIFNIVMYAFVPSYRSMLSGAVGQDDGIPVVDVNADAVVEEPVEEPEEVVKDTLYEIEPMQELPLATSVESAAQESTEKQIIGKEYHEDCGSGAGYWVITYEDGSTDIEQY